MLEPVLPKRFRLVRQLGEGGMGVVYEALDEEGGARVAVKTVRHLTPESLARFKYEFHSLADIHHPNVVTLGELVAEGGNWFFTMELVEGDDFLAYVRPQGSGLDEARLRSALRQLVGALAALHDAGVVHRDVKPSNVRVTSSGRVVLLDFGLATDATKDRSTAKTAGTPAYMAPEQALTGAVGPEADWYAVGVLLYEALTGALPFMGSPFEVTLKKQSHAPDPPRARARDVPVDLDALCVALLEFDPKARPRAKRIQRVLGMTETLAGSSRSSIVEQAPFVGRSEELATLRSAFQASREGASVSVLVEGESGIGKSFLVGHFTARLSAEQEDLVVLAGRCHERDVVSYNAFDGVVRALVHVLLREGDALAAQVLPSRPEALVQVFPALRRVDAFADATREGAPPADPGDLRDRAFTAMRELLGRLAAARPCVVVIDDLHWADADSLALLMEITRPPEEPPVLFVATASTPLRFALDARARTIAVARMREEDARTLTARLLERRPAAAPDLVEEIVREAGGLPLVIDAFACQPPTAGAPIGRMQFEDAVQARVASLTEGARRAMQILAVAGAPVTQETLANAVGEDPAALGRDVSLLRAAHLASITGTRTTDTIEPYHRRVGATVLASLTSEQRVAGHRALAMALEQATRRETEALALHWRGAGDLAQAAVYAAKAGDEAAAALAFDRAVVLYQTTIELGRHATAASSALLEKLGDALVNAGRGDRAAAAYEEASRGATAARALDLQRRGADQLLRSGHFDAGLATMTRLFASIGVALPGSPLSAFLLFLVYRAYLRVRGLGFRARDVSEISPTQLTRIDLCWSLAFGLAMADTLRGAAFNARNLVLALRSGERYRIARAIALEACLASIAGGSAVRRTEVLVQRARTLAAETGHPHAIGWTQIASGFVEYQFGHYKRALEHIDQGKKTFDGVPGAVWELDSAAFFTILTLVQLGQIGRVVRETPKAVREARRRGDLYSAVNLRIDLANLAWVALDDTDAAIAQIDEAMSEWSKQGFQLEHHWELMARTNALVYGGRAREAHSLVVDRWPALRRSLLPSASQAVRIFSLHARARSALATSEEGGPDGESLLRAVATAARRIERERMAYATPWATLLRAGIAARTGRTERAVAALREAISGFDAADMALYAAASRRCLGLLLGGDEGRDLARATDAWMTSESIKNPARMTAMLVPGFGRAG